MSGGRAGRRRRCRRPATLVRASHPPLPPFCAPLQPAKPAKKVVKKPAAKKPAAKKPAAKVRQRERRSGAHACGPPARVGWRQRRLGCRGCSDLTAL